MTQRLFTRPRSSSFSNNLSALRTAGLVEYPSGQTVSLTGEGTKRAGTPTKPLTLFEYHAGWERLLSGPQGDILTHLANCYPEAERRDSVARATGASPTSSSFANNLSTLRSFDLLDYPDTKTVRATSLLFPKGLART